MLGADAAWYAGRALQTIAQAGPGEGVDVDVDVGTGIGGGAGGALLTTLIVGALLIALAPDFTEERVATVWDDWGGSFLWGLIGIGGVIAISILLVISLIGILFVIPFLILAYVAWAVGATIAFLAAGERLADAFGIGVREDRSRSSDEWGDTSTDDRERDDQRDKLVPLLIAAVLNGGLTATGIGGLVSLGIGMVGFGALLRDYLG